MKFNLKEGLDKPITLINAADKFGSDNAASYQSFDMQDEHAEMLMQQEEGDVIVNEDQYKDRTKKVDINLADAEERMEIGESYYDQYGKYLREAVDWDKEFSPEKLFTLGNSKVGQNTIMFNLQPARFCPSFEKGMCKIVNKIDGQYRIACYAYQDERQYTVTLQSRMRMMHFWDTHTAEEVFDALKAYYRFQHGSRMVHPVKRMVDYITTKGKKAERPDRDMTRKDKKIKFIRFNQSGDLKDVADAIKMDRVAELALKDPELKLISYTYTARKDIVEQYKFKYVVINGSAFSADTETSAKILAYDKKGGVVSGKIFKAFPSIYGLRHKEGDEPVEIERVPGVVYYEDLVENEKSPDYDRYSATNPTGWFKCRGDCNSCPACKDDRFKKIAVKIHRAYQMVAKQWHRVEEVGEDDYHMIGPDPYEREALTGDPLEWTDEFKQEYETRDTTLKREKQEAKLPREEKIVLYTDKLRDLYDLYDPYSDPEEQEEIISNIKKWQNKAKRIEFDFAPLKAEFAHKFKRK